MKIRNIVDVGKFDTEPTGDGVHRTLVASVMRTWEVYGGSGVWTPCRWCIHRGRKWDGCSRPGIVGWFIPRWGVYGIDSLYHDDLYSLRPDVGEGHPISRKHADLLFFAGMMSRAGSDWQRVMLAATIYRAVWAFAEPVWDKHDQ